LEQTVISAVSLAVASVIDPVVSCHWRRSFSNGRAWLGQSRHVTDRSSRIDLAGVKRTVIVIAYRLFHSPANTCITQR